MKETKRAIFHRVLLWLMTLAMLISTWSGLALAEAVPEAQAASPLTPDDLTYSNGNVILHKQAERIGPDEWKVNVKVTVGQTPVEKRKLEVVFVLDCSGSMAWCTDQEAHEAGSHRSHSDSCYNLICPEEDHTHSYPDCTGSQCTENTNPDHWQSNGWWSSHIGGTTCIQSNRTYYLLDCDKHVHDDSCYGDTLICGGITTHSNSGATACTYVDENGNTVAYKSRLQEAKEAINTVVSNLTKDGSDNVIIKYVIFSSANSQYDNGVSKPSNKSAMVVSSLANVTAEGGTYMYTGIETGIDQFSDSDYKKVLVVLTDGAANDNSSSAPSLSGFKDPSDTDGTVFTVGFGYNSGTLGNIAGNGGSYVHASNAEALQLAFSNLEQKLTAMLEDPMGVNVGFTSGSIEEIQNTSGIISNNGDTIYWHPKADGTDTVVNSIIEYNYKVKLDEETADNASMHTIGTHSGVPLNQPTYFMYGIQDANGNAEMQSSAFPIPEAEYAYSSVQTFWQAEEEEEDGTIEIVDVRLSTDVDKIICDYSSGNHIPKFTQNYQDNPPIIPKEGSNDYYRYVGTTVTATDAANTTTELNGVEDVVATNPVAYKVVHQYELVKANELFIGGTKSLKGRDFKAGDSFSFTLTAQTEGAPMPENAANGSLTVSISPDSGSSMAFSFGTVVFTEAGKYTYTIQEKEENLDKVIYDTAVRTMVVTVTEENDSLLATYTIDGVENAAVNIVNRLETGSLKVEKTQVISPLDEHQEQEFGFLINVKNQSNRPISGDYPLEMSDGTKTTVSFTNGLASVKLKAGQSVIISDLPDGAVYTVTEDAAGGFTPTATGDTGTIAADVQSEASFLNTYAAESRYQFLATKYLDGGTMKQGQFTFSITDAQGYKVAGGTNNSDGSIFFDTLTFTHEDVGEKVYHYIAENQGTDGSYIYDHKVYTVILNITDNGDGTLSIVADTPNEDIIFTNRYVPNLLRISKKVAGNMGNRYLEFPFTLSAAGQAGETIQFSTDGVNFQKVTLDSKGKTQFTLKHDDNIYFYPVSGTYTVTETAIGSYTTTYSLNGATAVEGTSATGAIPDEGSNTVAFVNTLNVGIPTGVSTSSRAALAGIALAMALLAIVYAGRRWKPLEK